MARLLHGVSEPLDLYTANDGGNESDALTNVLLRVNLKGASIAAHTLIGPLSVVDTVDMNSNLAVVAGVNSMHAIAPLSAISEAVAASDVWHTARSVGLQTTDDRGDDIVALFGRVNIEGGVDSGTQLTRVSAGVGLRGVLVVDPQSPDANGIVTVGQSLWSHAEVSQHTLSLHNDVCCCGACVRCLRVVLFVGHIMMR
jgi:hypothetical protein